MSLCDPDIPLFGKQSNEPDEPFEIIGENELIRAQSTQKLVIEANKTNDKQIDETIKEIRKSEKDIQFRGEDITEEEYAIIRLVELRNELHEWTEMRQQTIYKLRQIADYIETISQRTGITKAISSGGGAIAGCLTLIGGAMTIATAGATSVPLLLAGAGLGLTAGLTGGAASIAEKVIKSKQMSEAEYAIEKDKKASRHLEETVNELRKNEVIHRQIAKQALISGAGAATTSTQIASLLTTGASGFSKVGVEAFAKIFGEDIGKELSKILLHSSGRVLSGSVTVVLGGATMLYDIYKLNTEIHEIAKLGTEAALEIRNIADQLDKSLRDLCGDSQIQSE